MYNSFVERRLPFRFSSTISKPFIQIYLCLILALFGWFAYHVLLFPYGADYGEAPIMDQVKRVENNEPIYKADINKPPYTIANYPPLYILSVAALNSTLKIPLFQAGRVISIIFTLASGAIVGLFGSQLTRNKWLGVFSAAIFMGNPYVLLWSSLARVDMMALGFSLLGLWLLYRSGNDIYQLLLVCLIFLISIYTRQTYLLAGPLAAIAWLWHQNKRRAIIFVVLLGGASLLLFGVINALTGGGFYTNIVLANINQYDGVRTLSMFRQLFIIWPFILIIALLAVCSIILLPLVKSRVSAANTKEHEFIIFGLGFYTFGALVSALTIGKVGSDVNYFLELIAVCSIWSVLGLDYLLGQKKILKFLSLGLIALQVLWVFIAGITLSRTTIDARWKDLDTYNTLFSRVQNAVREGTVLSDDYLDMIVLSGQPIYYQPFEYGQLYYANVWDPTQFVSEIEQGVFPLILIGGDTVNKACCWPPPVAAAVENNYLTTVDDSIIFLTPKK